VKYVLVDKGDNIITTVDLASNIGLSGAKTYFRGIKRMNEKDFSKLWKVMTRDEYDRLFYSSNRPPSHQGIRWWEEDKEITDSELGY
tara:strand:- start:396 stop:656 length:261 start_codon:yes stop_codon:yes gene_type:complete